MVFCPLDTMKSEPSDHAVSAASQINVLGDYCAYNFTIDNNINMYSEQGGYIKAATLYR